MELQNVIFGRRSIRRFMAKPVSEEWIEKILASGFSAPSASNKQPWEFIVVTERSLLDEVPNYHQYAAMLREAPVGIVCCGNTKFENRIDYLQQDVAAAIQNMLLTIHDLGLGGVWLGVYPVKERVEGVRKTFSIPEEVIPVGIIALGFPAENKPPHTPTLLPGRVHRNKYTS
ncbi:MAG: nitroreductase family protein [Spirochaetes bacterium]|nr:nitroreductase family protein [Spirochaetota bacterium]